ERQLYHESEIEYDVPTFLSVIIMYAGKTIVRAMAVVTMRFISVDVWVDVEFNRAHEQGQFEKEHPRRCDFISYLPFQPVQLRCLAYITPMHAKHLCVVQDRKDKPVKADGEWCRLPPHHRGQPD